MTKLTISFIILSSLPLAIAYDYEKIVCHSGNDIPAKNPYQCIYKGDRLFQMPAELTAELKGKGHPFIARVDDQNRLIYDYTSVVGYTSRRIYYIDQKVCSKDAEKRQKFLEEISKHNPNMRLIKKLTRGGVDIDLLSYDGTTSAFRAAKNGNLELLRGLVDLGADLRFRDAGQESLLYAAAWENRIEVVKYLVEQGFDVNQNNWYGITPLHCAVRTSRDMTIFLIQNGARVNITDNDGNTTLHWAAVSGNEDTLRILIENGASINSISKYGWTPLHSAIKSNTISVVRVLLTHGSRKDIKTKKVFSHCSECYPKYPAGATPMDFARIENFHEAILLLRK